MLKFMKIFLFCTVLFGVNLNAASDNFIKKYGYEVDYDTALEKAKSSNKQIMMVLSTKSCPWCRKFERQTLKKTMINDIVDKDFIPVALDKNNDFYPDKFATKIVPTTFFINPKDESVESVIYGYKNKRVFKGILLEAIEDYEE